MGRPLLGSQAMTGAERLRRHRATHGRGPDPTNAARQQRWRDRQAGLPVAKRALEEAGTPKAPDLLLTQAVAILESRGLGDVVPRLREEWPDMEMPWRQALAAGKSIRFWLRED